MKYCKKCIIPDTRPHIIFNDDGVCQACINNEKQKTVNWDARYEELRAICNKYRRDDCYYDCIIAVSGGKDSTFLTYVMKEEMNMNPLLVCVADPFEHTETGIHNLRNLSETFNCDTIRFDLSANLFRRVTKVAFEELGEPLRFIEACIYTVPYKFSVTLNIPLLVFGENGYYLYGNSKEDFYDVTRFIETGHSAAAEKLSENIEDFWLERGFKMKEINAILPPPTEDIERVKPKPIFMSYFVPWDDERNYLIAKRYGMKDLHHEWHREGSIEEYAQIDSLAYFVHLWLKYPKFGFSRSTDIACRWIRKGKITREEGIRLAMQNDHRLDQRSLDDFISFMGYTAKEFWDITEKFYNKDIFEKINGVWRLKNPLWKLENAESYLALPPNVKLK